MGEPLSVAGSAVGIISLGIQVCNGLLVYADAIRGREQDMADRTDEVRSLLSLFNSLEQTIGRIAIESPDNARLLLEYLRQAEGKLRILRELLEEVTMPTNIIASLKGKMKETCRVAVYPMKKKKFENARQTVQALVYILTAAQQAVGLELEVSQANMMKQIQSATISIIPELKSLIEANSRDLQALQLNSERRSSNIDLAQQELKVSYEASASRLESFQLASQRGFANLNNSVASTKHEVQIFSKVATSQLDSVEGRAIEGVENTHLILSKLAEISLQLERFAAGASLGTTNSQHLVQNNHQMVARRAPHVSPTSLRQADDPYATSPGLVLQSVGGIDQSLQFGSWGRYMTCKCLLRPRKRRQSLFWWGGSIHRERIDIPQHHSSCLFAKCIRKSSLTKAGVQFRLQLRAFFAAIIDINLVMMAGELQLRPSLRWKSIVFKSPVSRLIRAFCRDLSRGDKETFSLQTRLQELTRQITMCFESGTAFPTDVEIQYGEGFEMQYWLSFLYHTWTILVTSGCNEEDLKLLLDTARWLAGPGLDSGVGNGSDWSGIPVSRSLGWSHQFVDQSRVYASDMLLLRWITDVVEPEDGSLAYAWISTLARYQTIVSISSLSSLMPWMRLPPIVRAILSRSIEELNYEIEIAPESVMEVTYGHTTLEIACAWSPGLKRLLQTEARSLLHQSEDCSRDLFYQCGALIPHPDSLDALLSAGMSFFPGDCYALWKILSVTTMECVHIMAEHLAERLKKLSELAFRVGLVERDIADENRVPDFATAARWCVTIQEMGVAIDPSIWIPLSDDIIATVYHCRHMPLKFFPAFYEHGVTHIHTRDDQGLPPMFIQRSCLLDLDSPLWAFDGEVSESSLDVFNILPWLTQHGLLAQKPQDPLNLGLNVHATGVHCIATHIGKRFTLDTSKQEGNDHFLDLTMKLLQELSKFSCRDKCVCWCNPSNKGCSPLKLLYKSHAHSDLYCGVRVLLKQEWQVEAIRNLFFDFSIFTAPTDINAQHQRNEETREANPTARALELLRLLTFEALEMTHTCCMPNPAYDRFDLILNCKPAIARKTRQDPHEQKSAALLDALMDEFSDYLKQSYRGSSLLEFIMGHWQERIQEVYALQEGEVQNMEHYLDDVQTGIWPVPLQKLLWPRDPRTIKHEVQKTEDRTKELEEDSQEDEDDNHE